MASGTFGFAAFEGIFFYFLAMFATASLVAAKLFMGPKDNEGNSKFFRNAFQVAYSHAFGNSMTYMLFWIMFYNVVHVVWKNNKKIRNENWFVFGFLVIEGYLDKFLLSSVIE